MTSGDGQDRGTDWRPAVNRAQESAVKVTRVFQAQCHVPGCEFRGPAKNSYEAARWDRTLHLEHHRQKENGGQS